LEAFVDTALYEVPGPEDKQKRKDFYYGKKKRHTVKTQTADNKNGLIVHISKSVDGKKHGYTLFKEQPPFPNEIDNYFDLGYRGVEKDFPELKVKILHKNRKDRNSQKHRKNITKN